MQGNELLQRYDGWVRLYVWLHLPSGGRTGLPGRRRKAYNRQMKYISEWHSFDPKSAQTYPKIDAPLQVRYANGAEQKGNFKELFSPRKTSLDTKITGWRYIKDLHIKQPRKA